MFVPTRFQVMYRSARNATAFIWNIDAYTVVASTGDAGALSICSEASVEASIVTPPSSAIRMYCGASATTFVVAVFDVMNCRPL